MTKMAAKWLKSIPNLRPKRLKNHTLWGRTYLYSPYKGVPPPPGDVSITPSRHSQLHKWLDLYEILCFKNKTTSRYQYNVLFAKHWSNDENRVGNIPFAAVFRKEWWVKQSGLWLKTFLKFARNENPSPGTCPKRKQYNASHTFELSVSSQKGKN